MLDEVNAEWRLGHGINLSRMPGKCPVIRYQDHIDIDRPNIAPGAKRSVHPVQTYGTNPAIDRKTVIEPANGFSYIVRPAIQRSIRAGVQNMIHAIMSGGGLSSCLSPASLTAFSPLLPR
jgi:hypothetical protein